MSLYKQQKQQPEPQAMLCWTGYAVCERIMLYKNTTDAPIELGKKTFHCIRRFSLDAIPDKCHNCVRDLGKETFFLNKEYYSPELLSLMVRVYIGKV